MSGPIYPAWQIYADQMVMLGYGVALWEPAPLSDYTRVNIGDLGYVRDGHFQLIFNISGPLNDRRIGEDVPLDFAGDVRLGPLKQSQPRDPGPVFSKSIRRKGASAEVEANTPVLNPGLQFSFSCDQAKTAGALLMTKYQTYREDLQRDRFLERSFTKHYRSWLAFAHEQGHNVQLSDLILVTGVDLTKDFSMLAFEHAGGDFSVEFNVGVSQVASASASAWGSWRTITSVHKNWGPQELLPPGSARRAITATDQDRSGPSDDYCQCVFVRGYRMRERRLLWPKVMKAAAEPRDVDDGDADQEGHDPEFGLEDGEEDEMDDVEASRAGGIPTFLDPFNPFFDHIFENSHAQVAIVHDRDFHKLLEARLPDTPGCETITELVKMTTPQVMVTAEGVGTFGMDSVGGPETLDSALDNYPSLYLPEAGPSGARTMSRAASIAVQPSSASTSSASARQHSASHAIASTQQNSQAAVAAAKDDSLTLDVYSHPAAVAYAQAHPRRTISTFGPYLLLQTIGEGEFAKIKLGLHSQWGEEVAVKLLHRSNLDQQHMTKVEREIEVLRNLKHPNIIRLYDVIETDNYIGIVFEHTSGGELFDHILAHRYLKEKDACKLFAQLISGVHYIHRKKVVHRDLRLETLFLDRHRNLIIGDFGFANHFEDKEDDLMQTSCGSPCYAAPELVISEGKYIGTAVDIWSCGVILYAMLAGYLPFDDDPANPEGDNINLLYQYIVNTPLTFPDYISEEARDLLKLMLVTDPAHRGTLEQVMAHHWLEPYAHLFVKSVDELERAAIDQLQLKRQALGPTTRSHARTAMPDATLDRPQLGGQQPPVNAVSKALAFVPSQASAPYLPEAGPSRAHGSSRAASIAVQPSFLSSAPASSRQHHASHAIASPQEISQAAAPANGDSLTRDVYAHPAAVAYAQAHPHRTIPTFGPYLLLQTISEGEFAKVKLGLHIQWGEEVAVKLLHRDNLDQQHMTEVEREIEVLRTLKHPNIVRLYDVIETEKYIGIVFEYASGGELFDHILAHRYLKEKDACKLFAQLISGVHYIHQKKVVHRDLKLETLFLDRHRNLIISDFGLANRFEQDDLMQTSCGSPWYAAPELVISDDKYVGTAVDIWSCGVILYAMLAGYLPFDDDPANPEGDNILLLYQYIVNTPLTFPDYISKEARDLLELMLVPDPAHRGTLEQVMAHHWLEPYAHLFVKSVDELERAAIDQLQLQRQALDRTTRPHARTLSQAASTSPGQTAQSATSKEKTKSSESVRHTTQVEFGETREDEPTAMPDATLDRPQLGRQQPPVNAVNKALPSVLGQPSVAASRSWSEPGPPPSSMDRAQLQPVEPLVAPAVHIASTSSPATSSVESSSFGSTSSPTPVAVSSAYTASARSDLGSPETPGSRPVVRFAGARDAVDIPLVPSGAGEDPARCADKDERAEIEAERRHEHGTSVERLGPNKILGSAEPFAPASAASSHGASDGAFVETPASEEDDGTWYKPQTTSKDAPASPMEVPGLGQGTPTASGTARKVMNWFLTKSAGEGDATSVAPIVVMSPAGPHARKESGTAKQLAPALRGSKPLPTLSAARTLGDRMRESLNIGVPRRLSAASTIRLHHGAVDQMMLVTNANPLEVMAHMRVVLQGIGVELHVETEYKYRCVRPKRKERPAKSSAGPGAATFKFVGSVGFSGVNRRGLPAPSRNLFSGTGKLRGLFMRRQPSQVLAMAHPISLVQTSPPPSTLELSPSSTLELSPSSTLEFSPSATLKLSPDEHTIYGDRNQDLGDEIRFSIELTKMDRLSDMYSITMRRLKGNLRSYKFVYNTVRDRADLSAHH